MLNAVDLDPRVWWFLSRASGMVAFGVLSASCALGAVFASRMGRQTGDQPWLLSLHRYLGALFLVTTTAHLGALAADGYVKFTARELFVPFSSSYRPGAVALGVLALYGTLCVEVSSLLMRRIPRRLWRMVHLGAYVVFVAVAGHAALAGTDAGSLLFVVGGTSCLAVLLCVVVLRVWVRQGPGRRGAGRVRGIRGGVGAEQGNAE